MKQLFTLFVIALLGATMSAEAQEPTYWSANVVAFDIGSNAGESAQNPILIKNGGHLAYLAQQVNAGNKYIGTYFKLDVADALDLSAHYWVPIGTSTTICFSGHFDGNGKTITGLKIGIGVDKKDYRYTGLFGVIRAEAGNSASVKNLTLGKEKDGSGIQEQEQEGKTSDTGALVGCVTALGTLEINGCVNYIPVTGNSEYTGGIGGQISGSGSLTLKKCINQGIIEGITRTGGISGSVAGNVTVEECINQGNVTGTLNVGGVTGYLFTYDATSLTLTGCRSEKAVITATESNAGGIAGLVDTWATSTITLTNCRATGSIEGTADYVGGIAGALRINNPDGNVPTISGCEADMTRLEGNDVHRVAGALWKGSYPGPDFDFFQPLGNYGRVAEPLEGQTWTPDRYGVDGINETEIKDEKPTHTLTLTLAPGIDLHGLTAGTHTLEEGGHLHLQFLPEDRTLGANDILFLIDGVETPFKDFGAGNYFSYILNPVTGDHTILLALKEYTVTLPEGFYQLPGDYNVAYGEPFLFHTWGTNQGTLKVYANGEQLDCYEDQNPLLRQDQGPEVDPVRLFYLVEKVIGPVVITAEGSPGSLTGNGNIARGDIQLRITNYELQIVNSTATAVDVSVYTVQGKNIVQLRGLRGSKSITLPPGIYFVKAAGTVYKITIN